MSSSKALALADKVTEHVTRHILPFWSGPALDPEQGGWMGWLSNDLTPDRSKPQGLILNSRILWAFSAAHLETAEPRHRELATRAYDILTTRFWDRVHGGAVWRLTDAWEVLDDSKKTYGQAFYIYALSEYHRAFENATARDCARELFELIEHNAYDPRHGGYFEVRNRDWSEAGPNARLSDKDLSEAKSMNAHLHVLEAYTNLYRIWQDDRLAGRLEELIGLFVRRILDGKSGHLHHFFDEEWNVRSDTYTFGHDIEASWLLCEAAEVLKHRSLMNRLRSLALTMSDAVLAEGVDADGGLFYEGKRGQVIDRGKEGWPQAEALVGFVNAWQISGRELYLTAAERVWEFIQCHLVDRVHGDWFWRITDQGQPDSSLPKVSEWKGPYHSSRACFETARRLRAGVHERKPSLLHTS